MGTKIALACDHGGYHLKESLKNFISHHYFAEDFGAYFSYRVDYPDYIRHASSAVSKKDCDLGIVICSSGVGASIVANKFYGIRAALCFNLKMVKLAKQHNNANILALGANYVSGELAIEMVKMWMKTEFLGDRHYTRLDKINWIEKIHFNRNDLIEQQRKSKAG